MELGGKPLLSDDFRTGKYISRVSLKMASHLDAPSQQAEFMFMTGALVYAGVYQHLTAAKRIPVQDTAIAELTGMNEADYILKADQDFRCETGELHELIRGRVLPVVCSEEKLLTIGMLGAGAVHALITESERSAVKPACMDAQFPDLADLFDNFPPPSAEQ